MLLYILLTVLFTIGKSQVIKTNQCSKAKIPFNVNDFLFHLPPNAPKSLMTAERLMDPISHYENIQEHIKLLNFFIDECKKFTTESTDPYYMKYAKHFPVMVSKFYCALVGKDRILSDFDKIDPEAFYTYLTGHEGDWDWLNPANVIEPATWPTVGKDLVINTILTDSKDRGLVAAAWDPLYSHFSDLLKQIAEDYQSGDTTRFVRFPVKILPASFLTSKFQTPPNNPTVVLSKVDIVRLTQDASEAVTLRINKFLAQELGKIQNRISSPIITPYHFN